MHLGVFVGFPAEEIVFLAVQIHTKRICLLAGTVHGVVRVTNCPAEFQPQVAEVSRTAMLWVRLPVDALDQNFAGGAEEAVSVLGADEVVGLVSLERSPLSLPRSTFVLLEREENIIFLYIVIFNRYKRQQQQQKKRTNKHIQTNRQANKQTTTEKPTKTTSTPPSPPQPQST